MDTVETTNKGGAQPGNQNAAKGKLWRNAILRAIAKAGGGVEPGLDKAATQLVQMAMDGDKWAIDHIADRMDGKPKQALVGDDEEDSSPIRVIVEGIKATHGG